MDGLLIEDCLFDFIRGFDPLLLGIFLHCRFWGRRSTDFGDGPVNTANDSLVWVAVLHASGIFVSNLKNATPISSEVFEIYKVRADVTEQPVQFLLAL